VHRACQNATKSSIGFSVAVAILMVARSEVKMANFEQRGVVNSRKLDVVRSR